MNEQRKLETLVNVQSVPPYEAPHIEAVLTPEELEREVLYAGTFSQPG
jgi:hypothetical protein